MSEDFNPTNVMQHSLKSLLPSQPVFLAFLAIFLCVSISPLATEAAEVLDAPLMVAQEADEAGDDTPLLAQLLGVDPANPPDFVVFLGRFHPLIVHLPISFLLLAGVLEVISRWNRYSELRPAVSFVLFWGAVSAVGAVVIGLLLSISGDYGGDDLWWHKWLGIGVAVTGVVAYYLKRKSINSEEKVHHRAYAGALTSASLLLVAASHMGGNLTHGSDYLTSYMPEPFRTWAGVEPREEAKPIVLENVDEAHVYNDIIAPILDARCTSCHNPKKSKGDLILTTQADILAGGESGEILIAGNAEDSDMYRRLILDADHDDRMPPSGRKPMSSEHTRLIRWWVEQGAPFDGAVAEVGTDDEVRGILDKMAEQARNEMMARSVSPADPAAIQALTAKNVLVMPLAQETNLLQASFLNTQESFDAEDLALLAPIAEQLTWLDLGKTAVTDEAMQHVSTLNNLTRLHLEKTEISDDGLAHLTQMENLEYLNLYGTNVSDAGLKHLESLSRLKNLYLWQTQVTQEGANALQAQLPELDINIGFTFPEEVSGSAD